MVEITKCLNSLVHEGAIVQKRTMAREETMTCEEVLA